MHIRSLLPMTDDHTRVVLPLANDDQNSDYINASYVYDTTIADDGNFYTHKAYIITQAPLESTVDDFWRMVWQEDTRCIIMLTDIFAFEKVF